MGIMTSRFISAAELMARVLGMPNYPFAVIEHPVSSASDAELEQRARKVVDSIENLALTAPSQQGPA